MCQASRLYLRASRTHVNTRHVHSDIIELRIPLVRTERANKALHSGVPDYGTLFPRSFETAHPFLYSRVFIQFTFVRVWTLHWMCIIICWTLSD